MYLFLFINIFGAKNTPQYPWSGNTYGRNQSTQCENEVTQQLIVHVYFIFVLAAMFVGLSYTIGPFIFFIGTRLPHHFIWNTSVFSDSISETNY